MSAMRAVRRRLVLLTALVGFSLPVIAGLQYRWLGELSALERLRAHATLETASRRASIELDAQLARLYDRAYELGRHAGGLDAHSADLHDALSGIFASQLVRQVHLIERSSSGPLMACMDRDSAQPDLSRAWPAWLPRPAGTDTPDAVPAGLTRNLLDNVPAIVVPLRDDGHPQWMVLELDREYIVGTFVPAMLAGGVHDDPAIRYDILITREDIPSDVVYASRPGLDADGFADWVSRTPLFALHSHDMSSGAAASLQPDAAGHRWRLFVRPQGPDLEAALQAVRRRNLGLGLGTLALLSVSVTMLVVSTTRIQRAAREQLEVVARMSHELRTPLASIRCAGDNLADSLVTSPDDTKAYGEMIRTEGQRLTRTLQDILLCCRLQARPETVLQLAPVDVATAIDAAVAESRLVVGDEAAAVETTVEPGLPQVMADSKALGLILRNLVVNALRHGDGSPVTVSARARRTAAGREVVISVADRGPGIPADERPHLFELFFRGREARNRQIDGTGIGLSLVREAVESHSGRIRVSSTRGGGTTFTVHLPGARAT